MNKLDYFKKKVIEHLNKLEKDENNICKAFYLAEIEIQKSFSVGTIRTWKGKKYIKGPDKKWRPYYEGNTRGAKMAIAALKRKVEKCTSEEELLQLILQHRDRFSDENGKPLPFVKELSDYVSKKNDDIESKKESDSIYKKEYEALDREAKIKATESVIKDLKVKKKSKKDVVINGEKKKEGVVYSQLNNIQRKIFDFLEEKTSQMPSKIDFSEEKYRELFSKGIKTPLENVKMSENQLEKLKAKNRTEYLAEIYDTLTNPSIIAEDKAKARIYIKSYENKKGKSFISVVVSKEKVSVVISNHYERNLQIAKKISQCLYKNTGDTELTPQGDLKESPINSTIPQTDIKSIRNHYESSKSVTGNKKTVTLPSGEKMKCHYKLVEAEAPTASHDEETFNTTKGFPTNKDGKNINDRDYKNDKDAQESVRKIANNFNSLALDSPPIVTKDGIVISGNNRTMSSKLAAKNGTDKVYLESLKETIDEFGIDEEELENFKNPRIVLEVDNEHEGEYTTQEFAQFNQDTKKTMNNVEKAVKLTKTLNSNKIQSIAESLTNYERMSDLYSDTKGCQNFVYKLIQNGIIADNEKAQYLTTDGMLNDTGKDFVETVLVGSVLNENNIRKLDNAGGKRIRQKLVRAILPLIENKGTGNEYSFNNELNRAVDIAVTVAQNHEKYPTVKDYVNQGTLFDEGKIDDVTSRLAEIIHDDGEKTFAQRMKDLGAGLRESSSGQQDIFLQEVESKDSLMRRFLEVRKSIVDAFNEMINKEPLTNSIKNIVSEIIESL